MSDVTCLVRSGSHIILAVYQIAYGVAVVLRVSQWQARGACRAKPQAEASRQLGGSVGGQSTHRRSRGGAVKRGRLWRSCLVRLLILILWQQRSNKKTTSNRGGDCVRGVLVRILKL